MLGVAYIPESANMFSVLKLTLIQPHQVKFILYPLIKLEIFPFPSASIALNDANRFQKFNDRTGLEINGLVDS